MDFTRTAPLDRWIRPRVEGAPVPLVLGTMNFGKRTPADESERIIARALERGIGLFDTANAYNDGESERILGRALRGRREAVAIATKVGFGRVAGKLEGLARERVRAAAEESLERLGTEYIDVFYLHVPDYAVPIDATLEGIFELVDTKKIRAFAVSNFASWQVLEIMVRCDARKRARPVIAQQLYNLLIRQLEIEYFRFARKHPLHTTVYNALAGGLLSGRHERGAPIPAGSRFDKNRLYQGRYWSERFFDLADAYRAVAEEQGMTLVDLSYAWLAGSPHVDSILIGPATVAQLDAAIEACKKTVSPEARQRIDEIHRAFLGTDASYAR